MIRGLAAVIVLFLSTSIASAQVGTPIPSGQTVTINAHGECRKVTNPGSGTRMVFTGTAAEWASFRDNPNGLTMDACSGGGTQLGGFNWYQGGPEESCQTVCASHGGVNMAGTRDYVGSGGNLANCAAVAATFGISSPVDTLDVSCNGGSAGELGCLITHFTTEGYENDHEVFRCINAATSATAEPIVYSGVYTIWSPDPLDGYEARVCACNN